MSPALILFLFLSNDTTGPIRSHDDLTLVPWAAGRQPLWDVVVVDSLFLSSVIAGSVCNPGTVQAEDRKSDK